ncbi:MAG: sensor histidine kinase [Ignavibacteriales bacterium]|nr:MAG: sensor histidine kinase [Ignavibacteriales bacterium]
MKLLNKISLYYILNTAILFMLGLFAIYFSVDWIISERSDGQLRDTSKEITLKLERGIKAEYPPLIEIKELVNENHFKSVFKDTTIFLEAEKENEAYRQYTIYKKVNDRNYKITVRTSLIEKEDLFSAILIILIIILALLLLILSLINRYTARKIFKPFYNNLKHLGMFSLHKNDSMILEDSNIDEFNELKYALAELSEKALKEYRSLKEFSEDLSHELQTPVAVIKAKAELLLQKEFTDAEISSNLQSIINNADRLDKLNRSLILLTKLETTDFFPTQKILLGRRIERIIDNYTDAINSKEIVIRTNLESMYEVEFNENLLDIALSNLISNSIKHNIPRGEIFIELKDSIFMIKNSGKEPKQNLLNYFKRFTYEEKSQNSLGLGLAIVKKICNMYEIGITYQFIDGSHTLVLNFNKTKD